MNIKKITPLGLVLIMGLSVGAAASADSGIGSNMGIASQSNQDGKTFSGYKGFERAGGGGNAGENPGDGGDSGQTPVTEITHNYSATIVIPGSLNQTAGVSYEVITNGVNSAGAELFSVFSGVTDGSGSNITIPLSSTNATGEGGATDSPTINSVQLRHLDRTNVQYFLIDSFAAPTEARDTNEVSYDFGSQSFDVDAHKQAVNAITNTANINFRIHYEYAGTGPVDCVAIKHITDESNIRDNCVLYPWANAAPGGSTLSYQMPNVNLSEIGDEHFILQAFRDTQATDEYNFNSTRAAVHAIGICYDEYAVVKLDNQGRYSMDFPTAHLREGTNNANNTCEGIRP